MTKPVIIYTGPEGNVHVCVPSGEVPIEVVQATAIPVGAESFIIDEAQLPLDDRDFFDAWEQAGGVISVSVEKAKAITKARLRAEREPLLAAQDVLYMRALERGQDTTAIVAEKQRLRDVTSLADSCTNLAALRALSA